MSLHTLLYGLGGALLLLIALTVPSMPYTSSRFSVEPVELHTPSTHAPTLTNLNTSSTSQCPFPLVYNKPAKTGSSYIRNSIASWTLKSGGHSYQSYQCGDRSIETAIRLQECIPQPDPCGVLNCHTYLDQNVLSLLSNRLPNFRLITSTRYAPHRIISTFLQMRHLKISPNLDHTDKLRDYLLHEYNPWGLSGWHSGTARLRACPPTLADVTFIHNIAARYYAVVDLTLREESNIILKHLGLFQIPDLKKRNERGSNRLLLNPEMDALLKNVSCFDRIMHRALQLRMASLYEEATGQPCIYRGTGHWDNLTSCLAIKEREKIGDAWMF